MPLSELSLSSYVRSNPEKGFSLFECGILFSDHSHQTIKQTCEEKGLNLNWVHARLRDERSPLKLQPSHFQKRSLSYTIKLLRAVHGHFIDKRLPFLQKLVQRGASKNGPLKGIFKDLEIIFPIFYQDFVHHIHEEEDELFHYLIMLEEVITKGKNPGVLELRFPNPPNLSMVAMEHLEEDDGMGSLLNYFSSFSEKEPSPS